MPSTTSIRTDGFYVGSLGIIKGENSYFRFYPEGGVMWASSVGEVKDMFAWLLSDCPFFDPAINVGFFVMDKGRLSFRKVNTYGVLEFSGALKNDQLLLNSINGRNDERRSGVFRFFPISTDLLTNQKFNVCPDNIETGRQ